MTDYVAEHRKQATTANQHSFRESLYWQKAVESTQKRYLKAVETLAKMRKLSAQSREIEQRADQARSANALKSAKLVSALSG